MKLILGTMTFGGQVKEDAAAAALIDRFTASGNTELDTAYEYCEGRTEELLGRVLPAKGRAPVYLASKVKPVNEQGLQPQEVRRQLDVSLRRLGRDSVDLLYLHAPDLKTPIERTLEACAELHQAGKFRDFGLSNYAAWQVAEVVETCRREGWMVPRVYQGLYNAVTRDVERELFPCLRNYGMSFYAYNPLAGGLLTGKYKSIDELPNDGRFATNKQYQSRYWKQDYFGVIAELGKACAAQGISPLQAALSWLIHHSLMDAAHGDGIILGITQMQHLQANLAACAGAKALDPSIIDVLDRGWELIQPNCFKYFRT